MVGQWPQPGPLFVYWLISLAVCWLGYAWFQKTRGGFADVL
jgi:lipopolysaccharide transport system permease protein